LKTTHFSSNIISYHINLSHPFTLLVTLGSPTSQGITLDSQSLRFAADLHPGNTTWRYRDIYLEVSDARMDEPAFLLIED